MNFLLLYSAMMPEDILYFMDHSKTIKGFFGMFLICALCLNEFFNSDEQPYSVLPSVLILIPIDPSWSAVHGHHMIRRDIEFAGKCGGLRNLKLRYVHLRTFSKLFDINVFA